MSFLFKNPFVKSAACLTKGNLLIKGFDSTLIKTELNLLKKIGAKIKTRKDEIHIKGPKKIKKISHIITKEYGGFPTDLQSIFMVLLCKGNGISSITENIFKSRFIKKAKHLYCYNRSSA